MRRQIKQPEKIKNELTEEQKREIKEEFSLFEKDGLKLDKRKLSMKSLNFDLQNEDNISFHFLAIKELLLYKLIVFH